jgi:UDP-glucose 4-epimerase
MNDKPIAWEYALDGEDFIDEVPKHTNLILVTGGLGFIGSHVVATLLKNGHEVVVLDNLSNSKESVHYQLEKISGKEIPFHIGDVRDSIILDHVFKSHPITSVMHFAGVKSVAESVSDPLKYYDNNVAGTIKLLKAMEKHKVFKLVFSSSATVYGIPHYLPLDEAHPTNPINPYGFTKLRVEKILADLTNRSMSWSIACLRYFNPVGAHPSGLIGELPNDQPNNLMPYITQVASKQRPFVTIYGNDYNTKDGTGERDYIHVMDLAEGHVVALNMIEKQLGLHTINLGTGTPYSVLEVLDTFEKVTGEPIPFEIGERRYGDLPCYYSSVVKAKDVLGWQAKRNLEDMCQSAWEFQKETIK